MQASVIQGCVLIPTEGYQFELLDDGGPFLWMAQVEWCEPADLPMRTNGVRTFEKLIRPCPTRCQGMDQRDPLKVLSLEVGVKQILPICVRNIDGGFSSRSTFLFSYSPSPAYQRLHRAT